MGTVFLPGLKWLGSGSDHSPPPGAEVKEKVEIYLYSTSVSNDIYGTAGQHAALSYLDSSRNTSK